MYITGCSFLHGVDALSLCLSLSHAHTLKLRGVFLTICASMPQTVVCAYWEEHIAPSHDAALPVFISMCVREMEVSVLDLGVCDVCGRNMNVCLLNLYLYLCVWGGAGSGGLTHCPGSDCSLKHQTGFHWNSTVRDTEGSSETSLTHTQCAGLALFTSFCFELCEMKAVTQKEKLRGWMNGRLKRQTGENGLEVSTDITHLRDVTLYKSQIQSEFERHELCSSDPPMCSCMIQRSCMHNLHLHSSQRFYTACHVLHLFWSAKWV